MHQIYNSPLVEAAKNYEFIKCDKSTEHQYYQINQICFVDKCPYQLQPLCNLDMAQSLFGKHQHQTMGLKQTLLKISEMCVQSQIKYQTQEKMNPNELERMFLIAKDFKKIGESALNISEYLMEIVNGIHGAKGLETILWDIFLCKSEDALAILLKKLRKHVRLHKGDLVMREYRNPKNYTQKINERKQQIEDEIINLCSSLKMEFQELKAKADLVKPKKDRKKELYDTNSEFKLAYDRSKKNLSNDQLQKEFRAPQRVDFVRSILYGKGVKEVNNKVYEGSGDGIDLLYGAKPFSKGLHEFSIKIEKFNKKADHFYVILLKEEEKESGANQYSPFHCLFCSDSNNMRAHPSKTSNFGPKLEEGSIIQVKIDVESNIFEIKDQGSAIYYSNEMQLYGDIWRPAIWWQDSNARVRVI